MEYDVWTDMAPDEISEVGFIVMTKWIAFALGHETLNGKRVGHPTGRYASSIRVEGRGPNHIAVVADEEIAPEAGILEAGAPAIDLKQKLQVGRAYPMHRGAAGMFGSKGYGVPVVASSFSARTKNIWATPRAHGFSGVARVPTEITSENQSSWIIPAMPAWAPAEFLAEQLRRGAIRLSG